MLYEVITSVSLPPFITVVATDEKGQIMAVRHKTHKTYGVQFHPESIMTDVGKKMLSNFLTEIAGVEISEVNAPTIPSEKRMALKKYIAKSYNFV